MTPRLALGKYHGLGNDFLVLFPGDAVGADDAATLARRVCDRHLGIGADGLLIGSAVAEGDGWRMVLYNADGSRAEMSGNGIRCFVHALVRDGDLDLPTQVHVVTDAGARVVTVEAGPDGTDDTVQAAVAMGTPRPGPAVDDSDALRRAGIGRHATWDLGNPHLVLEVDDPGEVDLRVAGPEWEGHFEDGVNVHFVRVEDRGHLTQVTWERGAGVTLACGTGATAAALSARTGVWSTTGSW